MALYFKQHTFKSKRDMTKVEVHCNECGNNRSWFLMSYNTWLTYLVVPVLPLNFEKYLVCPCCENKILVNKRNKEKILSLVEESIDNLKKVYDRNELL